VKLLILTNHFPPSYIGGYELGTLEIADYLHSVGHEITVLTSNSQQMEFSPPRDYGVLRILENSESGGFRKGYYWIDSYLFQKKNLEAIELVIKEKKIEFVLQFNTRGLGIFGIYTLIQYLDLPGIVYLMDNIYRGKACLLDEASELSSLTTDSVRNQQIVVMSQQLLDQIRPYFGHPKENVVEIPGWIPEGVGIEGNRKTSPSLESKFVFSSRISEHKGAFLLLKSFRRFLDRQPGFMGSLDFYGDGEVKKLQIMIKNLKLEPWVSYKGSLAKEKMIEVFGEYDALVFPTWKEEAFGYVVIEAMSQGCIPLATSGIGSTANLKNSHDFISIEPESTSIVNALEFFIGLDSQDRVCLKLNAQNTASKYSFKECVKKLDALIVRDYPKSKQPDTNQSQSTYTQAIITNYKSALRNLPISERSRWALRLPYLRRKNWS
jgi:glycosyltransferase involved in cell wall biosynthesis